MRKFVDHDNQPDVTEVVRPPRLATFWFLLAVRNERCFELVGETGYKALPPAVLEGISSIFDAGQTKVVEGANQRLRRAETQGQSNQVVSNNRAWLNPVQHQVLSKIHSYPEIDHNDASELAVAGHKLDAEIFKPSSSKGALPLRAVMDSKKENAWPSFSVAGLARQSADLAFWMHCAEEPADSGKQLVAWYLDVQWHAGGQSWQQEVAVQPWTCWHGCCLGMEG